ncbi:MAG: hypothetical protein AAF938_08050 [Myxococcota bacterium]
MAVMTMKKKIYLGLGGVVVALFAWSAVRVAKTGGAATVCEGGTAGTARSEGDRWLAFRAGARSWITSPSLLPRDVEEADSDSDVTLVACVDDARREPLSACTYENGARVQRFQWRRRVRLVEAASGRALGERDVTSPEVACPATFVEGSEGSGVQLTLAGIPVAELSAGGGAETPDTVEGDAVPNDAVHQALVEIAMQGAQHAVR